MGTWSAGSFGNDAALDFVDELNGFGALEDTLLKLSKTTGELDADAACVALAACDLLAACMGRPPQDLPEDLPELPDCQADSIPDGLPGTARALVARVRKGSELAELWQDADDAEWQQELDGLLLRLDPSRPWTAPVPEVQPEKPDDFIGYCYICYEMVTERDGLHFEHWFDNGSSIGISPHRNCIEARAAGPGPYWLPDGSPAEATRRQLLLDMGLDLDN